MQKYSLEQFRVIKHEETFQNGLKVIFIEKPFAPIYAKLMIRAGSIYNGSDSGLAHLTEHIIVSGSEKYPKKEDFAGITASVGGYANANTSRTELCVECEVAIPDHMKNMTEYFSEALSAIYITSESLKKEIGVVTSEIKGNMSKPLYIAGRQMANIWANGTNWGCSNLGTVESVSSITIDDVQNFFYNHCCVENMLLVIAGGCTIEDIRKTFSEIQFLRGVKAELPESPSVLAPKQRVFIEQNIEQTNISVFFNAPVLATRESILLDFAMKYAHDGLSSRFYKKLRNERGIVYNLGSPRIELNHLAYTGTVTGVPPEKVDFAFHSIFECYSELLREGITQKELDDKLTTKWFTDMREMETSYDWVKAFADAYPEQDPIIGDYPDIYNFMQEITADEVNSVMRKYLILNECHLGINGKQSSKNYF